MDEKDREAIYHFRNLLESALSNVTRSDICNRNKQLITNFAHDSLAKGLAPSNVLKYVLQLKVCARILDKPFTRASRQDLVKLVGTLEAAEYTPHTKRTMKTNIKIFYKWLRGVEEYPEEVRWIKPGTARNRITPGDLLASDEIERMIDAAITLRDKTLISVFYESACRPQEILPLRIKQLQFDKYGALITVNGKIGVQRTLRLIASVALLSAWLNVHPRKSDLEAPLFPSFDHKNLFRFLTYGSFKKVIEAVAEKAQISKRVYPYLFRHSRLTELARMNFTGYQFNLFAGWALDSKQATTYIHLLSKDVDDAILKLNGIRKEESSRTEFSPVTCTRCKQPNTPGTNLCLTCGFALNIKAANETELRERDIKAKLDLLSTELAKSPEVVDVLLKAIATLRSGKPPSQ